MPVNNRVELAPKLPAETVPRTVDFISKLPTGVTITGTPSVTISVWSGNDPTPILSPGTPTVNGTQVTCPFSSGVTGVIYLVNFTVVGSDTNTYQLFGYLAVVPNAP